VARQDGVEGGIWQAEAGPLAYAFPTYQGTGPRRQLLYDKIARYGLDESAKRTDDVPKEDSGG
jgi:hypothetical protein